MTMVSNSNPKTMQKQTSETVTIDLLHCKVDVSGIFYHPEPDTYDREGDRADFEIKSIDIYKGSLTDYTDDIDCFYQSDLKKEYGNFQNFLTHKVLDNLLF